MTTETTILTDDELRSIQAQHLHTVGHRDARRSSAIKAGRAIEHAVPQSPEIQALKKDAQRYGWLRDTCGIVEYQRTFGGIGSGMLPSGRKLDMDIDAAMQDQKP